MKKIRNIKVIGSVFKRTDTPEFSVKNISSKTAGTDIEPVLSIDHFRISKPQFPPHPHAGFSAVTYLFEDSEGEFISRDSGGGHFVAKGGGVIWNVTGKGALHEEYPKTTGKVSHGLQTFINIPAAEKMQDPKVYFVNADQMPIYKENGVSVRIVSGSIGHLKASFQPPGNISYFDIKMEANSRFLHHLPEGENVLLYVIKGSVLVGENKQELHALQTAVLDFEGTDIQLVTTSSPAQVVLISGKQNPEPLVFGGAFIMNTEAQVQDAMHRYRSGEMGHLEAMATY